MRKDGSSSHLNVKAKKRTTTTAKYVCGGTGGLVSACDNAIANNGGNSSEKTKKEGDSSSYQQPSATSSSGVSQLHLSRLDLRTSGGWRQNARIEPQHRLFASGSADPTVLARERMHNAVFEEVTVTMADTKRDLKPKLPARKRSRGALATPLCCSSDEEAPEVLGGRPNASFCSSALPLSMPQRGYASEAATPSLPDCPPPSPLSRIVSNHSSKEDVSPSMPRRDSDPSNSEDLLHNVKAMMRAMEEGQKRALLDSLQETQ